MTAPAAQAPSESWGLVVGGVRVRVRVVVARLAWNMGKWIAQLVSLSAKSATQPAARCPVEDLRPM